MLPDNPAGSNMFPETPVPLQLPPEVPVISAFRFIGALPLQSEVAVQLALPAGVTVIFCVDVPWQPTGPTV